MGASVMKIKNILIGEDIRQELGNKISLMGILGDALKIDVPPSVPKELPLPMALAFLVSIENTDPKNDPKDFKINIVVSLCEKQIAKINAQASSTGEGRISHLPIPKIGFQLIETTTLTIQVQVTKNDKLISESSAHLKINLNRHTAQPIL
jgi:hypothetical protein